MTGAWAFTKACTNQEAAGALLDSFYCEEAEMLEDWGIEGLTYEVVDGKNQYLPNIDNAHWEECAKNGTVKGDWPGQRCVPEDPVCRNGNGDRSSRRRKSSLQKSIIGHEPSFPLLQRLPSGSAYREQLERKTELKTDLDTYTKELATQLVLGQKSLDDWDSYMAELKDLGLDEILEIENDQL